MKKFLLFFLILVGISTAQVRKTTVMTHFPGVPGTTACVQNEFGMNDATADLYVCGADSLFHLITGSSSGPPQAQQFSVSPTTVNFNQVQTSSQSQPQSIAFTSSGTVGVTILVSQTGSSDFVFPSLHNCDGLQAAGAVCILTFNFAPSSTGAKSGSITITTDIPGSAPFVVSLLGTGTAVATSPLNVSATDTGSGTIKSAEIPPLINCTIAPPALPTGTCATNVPNGTTLTLTATPAAGSHFQAFNGATCSVSPCTLTVSTPGFSVTGDFSANGPANIPTVSVAPTNIAFGTVQTGTTSPTQNITISNTSATLPLTINSVVITGSTDFSSSNLSLCNETLTFNAACVLSVQFHPTSGVAKTATITVNTNAATTPTVALTGSGTALATFNLTVNATGSGSGSVQSGDGSGDCASNPSCTQPTINCSFTGGVGSCTHSYPTGTVVVLTATPTSGNTFNTFSGGGCSTSPCSVTLAGNTAVTSAFTAPTPTSNLNVTGTGQGGGTITSDISDPVGIINCISTAGVLTVGGGTGCTGVYNQGSTITLTAVADGSSSFIGWTGVLGCGIAAACVVPISTTDITATANFAPTVTPTALIQSINGGTGGTNNIVGNFTQAQLAGDTNVVFIAWNDATKTVTGVTDTKGNAYTQASCTGSPQSVLAVYYSVGIAAAGAGANNVTVAMSGSPSYRVIMANEYSGLTSFDVCHGANGSGTALDSGAFTTTAANDILIGGTNVSHGISAVSTGYTQEISNSGNDIEDLKNVAIGTYHFQPTMAPAGSWWTIGTAFKTGGVVTPTMFSLTLVGSGNGSGSVALPGTNCTFTAGSTPGCSIQVSANSAPTIVASASSGSNFGGWSGVTGCSASAACTVPSITSNTIITVSFTLPSGGGPFDILNQPSVDNRPYPTAYYNKKLPNAGSGGPLSHLMPNSVNVVSTVMKNGGSSLVTSSGAWNSAGTDDGQHSPLIYGKSTDPVYQVSGCTGPSESTSVNGQKFHAPSAAPYNQGAFDREIVIWDQPSNIILAFNGGSGGPTNLPVCTSGTAANPCNMPAYQFGGCSAANHDTQSGIDGGTGAGTAGLSPFGNRIRIFEVYNTGHINHGLRGIVTCVDTNNGTYPSMKVFPATTPSGFPSNNCPNAGVSSTNRPPEGALFFLDYTQTQLDCFNPAKSACGGVNKLLPWQYMLIEAVTFYGITVEDTGPGNSISLPGIESEQAYVFYDAHGYPGALSQADAFTNFMNANCSGSACSVTQRCTLGGSTVCGNGHSQWQWNLATWANISLQAGQDIIGHMHVADPCVAIAVQGLPNDGNGTNACP
jgi:hypothetical protein